MGLGLAGTNGETVNVIQLDLGSGQRNVHAQILPILVAVNRVKKTQQRQNHVMILAVKESMVDGLGLCGVIVSVIMRLELE